MLAKRGSHRDGGWPYRMEHPPGLQFCTRGELQFLYRMIGNMIGKRNRVLRISRLTYGPGAPSFRVRTILPYLSIDAFQPGGTTTVVSNSSSTSGPPRAPRKRLPRGKIRVRSSPVFAPKNALRQVSLAPLASAAFMKLSPSSAKVTLCAGASAFNRKFTTAMLSLVRRYP